MTERSLKITCQEGDLLDPDEVAERLGIQTGTLATWRVRGFGPPFLKVGRSVRYPLPELEAWAASRVAASTSTYRRGA